MKKLPISLLAILSIFLYMKGSPPYGMMIKKWMQALDDKSELITTNSTDSSSNDNLSQKG